MDILIIGTGVIGTLYGKVFSEQHNVEHYVKQEKNFLNKKKIAWDIIDERQPKQKIYTNGKYTYNCVTHLGKKYDLIFVPVGGEELSNVLEIINKANNSSNFLIFSLEWNILEKVHNILNPDQYVIGYPGGGGTFRDELLWGNIGNDVMLGKQSSQSKILFSKVFSLFENCGIRPTISEEPENWIRIHIVSSAILGFALSKSESIAVLLQDKKMMNLALLATREGYKICSKIGIKTFHYKEIYFMKYVPIPFLRRMFHWNITKNRVMERYTAHALKSLDEMKLNFEKIYVTGQKLDMKLIYLTQLFHLVNKK